MNQCKDIYCIDCIYFKSEDAPDMTKEENAENVMGVCYSEPYSTGLSRTSGRDGCSYYITEKIENSKRIIWELKWSKRGDKAASLAREFVWFIARIERKILHVA